MKSVFAVLVLLVWPFLVSAQIPTGSTQIPIGSTALRPLSPKAGEARVNTDCSCIEFWTGSIWSQITGASVQQVDTLTLSGTILGISLSGDGVAQATVDLVSLAGSGGTDDQNLSVGAGTGTTSLIQIEDGTGITLEASTGLSISEAGSTITLTNTGDTNAADDLTTSTSFAGDVTGAYNTLEIGASTVGTAELSVNVVSSVDGVTNDGGNIDLVAGSNVTITPDDGANTITIAATNTQLSEEQVEDFVGGMVTGNTETGITVTYEDADGTLDFVATDPSLSNEGSLTVGAGTATTSLIQSNTSGSTAVTLEAGTGVTLSESGNTITITAAGGLDDGDYGDISVSGSGTVLSIDAGVVGADELASTAVTPGSYTLASVTIDADGRITGASSGSEVDGSITNEGALSVVAGGANDSQLQSNTSGSTNVTISGGTGIQVSESGSTITISATGTTLNSQTGTAYTLVLADAGKTVTMHNAAANTLTVPPNSSIAFPVGTVINVASIGAGQTTVAAGAGVTVGSADAKLKLRVQYSSGSLIKIATDTWLLVGDIVE